MGRYDWVAIGSYLTIAFAVAMLIFLGIKVGRLINKK